ncbi:hypothetical protein CC80DRAFT_4807 [Byssothecium circinans]|uniref:Uncharacterized protein n=1 Tax=Byssothecium circinans TaxID=147558 RepID=A0A6A5UHG7_9PLEO|nr:hypothetical protein CC80DRAFT_4807 [Byssothecium circinans]
MATPQDLTTTVNGRRCTRSRARTAATSTTLISSEPPPPPPPLPATTSSTSSTSITSQAAQQIQTSAADPAPQAPPPPPPPPPPSSTPTRTTQAAQQAPAPPTQAASSTIAVSSSTPSLLSSILSSTSVAAVPDTATPSAVPSNSPLDVQPDQPQPTETDSPLQGSAGAIGTDQGRPEDENGLTLPATGQTNVAGIAGGVVGGFVGIALISALLFFCLRRRKTGAFEKWQQRMSEKRPENDGPFTKIKEKFKSIPAGVGLFFAKMKGKKSGPASNPYRRHSIRSSVSSIYSVQGPGRRSQSISEPPSKPQQQFGIFANRMPSLKRSKTLLHKKQDSLVVGDSSPFPGIVEDPVARNSKNVDDPFKDPTEQPKNLFVLNPDRRSAIGLQDQQRGPLTPKPIAKSERASKDPLASILDEIKGLNGSGTPEWLRENAQKHKRTTSAQTALTSHPPSNSPPPKPNTVYDNPFFDPTDVPPVPTQQLPPNPPSRPVNAYAPMPSFNATSSTVSRESDVSFFFGEPGPSRPTTNMFGSKVRQSDPFDLDRPEVLSFGNVGGRTIRSSTVNRQASRKRGSSVPNWVNVNDGPYERANAVPTRGPSTKR